LDNYPKCSLKIEIILKKIEKELKLKDFLEKCHERSTVEDRLTPNKE